jgi:hypothetical protein
MEINRCDVSNGGIWAIEYKRKKGYKVRGAYVIEVKVDSGVMYSVRSRVNLEGDGVLREVELGNYFYKKTADLQIEKIRDGLINRDKFVIIDKVDSFSSEAEVKKENEIRGYYEQEGLPGLH